MFVVHQGVGGADLSVWAAYGRAEGAGGTDATGSAHLDYSSLSTSSTNRTICPLCGCCNLHSPTGSNTIILICVWPGLLWLCEQHGQIVINLVCVEEACVFSALVVQ